VSRWGKLLRGRLWRKEDLGWREEERDYYERDLLWREEDRRWRAQDIEQRCLDNARWIWARFVEKNRRYSLPLEHSPSCLSHSPPPETNIIVGNHCLTATGVPSSNTLAAVRKVKPRPGWT
jgi:hypothetical protein